MHETDMNDWDHLPNGDIEALPLAGWEMGAAPGLVLLRLEIQTAPGQIGTAQLSIPADRAEEMAQTLQWLAARSRSSADEGRT